MILSILLGLIVGSFLTVCIYRIPYGREKGPGDFGQCEEETEGSENTEAETAEESEAEAGISIAVPSRSFCPECQAQLLWWHNLPVLSWLLLRGRCYFCHKPISVRYPLVELFTALTALLCFQQYDLATGSLIFVFCCALIVISLIDCEYYIIPDVITFPGMALGIALAGLNQYLHFFKYPVTEGWLDSFWGLMAGGGFLYVVSKGYYLIRKKVGLGFGDVKLLAVVGLFFGPVAALYTIFFGSFVGSILGALLLLALGQKMSKPLPFGPYLAIGTYLYLFVGPDLPKLIVEAVARIFV